jgi:tRNA threonylcarbamoyladenosine biosynthesis protein TsaE
LEQIYGDRVVVHGDNISLHPCGCRKNDVKSPTFVIVNIYRGTFPMFHIDFYRLERKSDLKDLGLEEILYGTGVSVIEWAEKFPEVLPSEHISVKLSFAGGNERNIKVQGKGKRAKGVIEKYAHCPEIRRNISS